MKPYLIYGSLIALANSVVTLALYLAGFHSDPEKISTAGYISMVVGLITGVCFMVAGVRGKRNLTPPTDNFTFGTAMGVAVVVSLFATLLSMAFQFVYQSFINPEFADVVIQAELAKMHAAGRPQDMIEKAEQGMRLFLRPAVAAVFNFIMFTVINVIISLIIAAIMKRKAVEETPLSPPPL